MSISDCKFILFRQYDIVSVASLIGMLALSGVTISSDVYSWITVFVLPINSALNPFLYTLLAIVKKKVKKLEYIY